MNKTKTITLALLAVLVVGGGAATNASANEWLLSGSALTTAIAADTSWELLLEDMAGFITADIGCSVLFSSGKDAVEKVVDFNSHNPLECSVLASGSCSNGVGTTILVTPVDLPWGTELLEPTAGEWRDDLTKGTGGAPGYEFTCKRYSAK
jgi:hypothetical protein